MTNVIRKINQNKKKKRLKKKQGSKLKYKPTSNVGKLSGFE